MKILSIRQPWAWLIVEGYKTIETRKWSAEYRGKLALHASKTVEAETIAWLRDALGDVIPETYETGAVVGVCDIVAIRPLRDLEDDARRSIHRDLTGEQLLALHDRDEWSGRPYPDVFGWELATVHKIRPVPWKGALGLRDTTPDLDQMMREGWHALHGGAG